MKTSKGLPGIAMIQIPLALSPGTKRELTQKSPEDVGRIIFTAIDKINRGSIEAVDALARKQL